MQFQLNPMLQTQENGQKPSKNGIKLLIKKNQDFFSKIGLRHFSPLTSEQLHAKNLRNPMTGSIKTFRDHLTN